MIIFGRGEEYMKPYTLPFPHLYGADKRGGRGENKARNEMPILGSFKFNCLVPNSLKGEGANIF